MLLSGYYTTFEKSGEDLEGELVEEVGVGGSHQFWFYTVPFGSFWDLVDVGFGGCFGCWGGFVGFLEGDALVEELVAEDHGHCGGYKRVL